MTISGFLDQVRGVIDAIVPFIIGLAVFVVIWGILRYVTHAADEEKRAEARQYIIYGIIGVFFMLSIWGFVNILYNTFDLDRNISPGQIPEVPQLTGSDTESDCDWNLDDENDCE